MQMKILVILLCTISNTCVSQDTDETLKKLEDSLKNKSVSVSEVLSSEVYMQLHSKTMFRNLIKKYAPIGQITIVTDFEPGKKIRVKCKVITENNKPFSNGLVYVYQTSAKGWYSDTAAHILIREGDMRHARLFGYVYTDENGECKIETVQPSGYPMSDLPAHIHISISKDGENMRGVPGELLFDDDERLTSERRKRAQQEGFLISKDTGIKSSPLYYYLIRLN